LASGAIENPIINSPFVEPARHFATNDAGEITGDIDGRRRPSECFVPVARPRKASARLTMDAFGGPCQVEAAEAAIDLTETAEKTGDSKAVNYGDEAMKVISASGEP
jgi:hypothetical protein